MKLSVAAILATAVVLPSASAAMTSSEVVNAIGDVTSTSGDVNNVLSGLSTSTDPITFTSTSQKVYSGFSTIINALGQDANTLQGQTPFDATDATPVADAFHTVCPLCPVQQALLSNIIGKHNMFAQYGQSAPVAAVLRGLEAAADSFAFALIAVIPSEASSAKSDYESLASSIESAISLYQQVCVPSPLYPSVAPVCVGL
ncbi:hypothetical protein FB451DRAFT_1038703 [Mycena latifolia]|nr:hypothetical protein FB451DRAFT_1038703 [Mycena latifolia]